MSNDDQNQRHDEDEVPYERRAYARRSSDYAVHNATVGDFRLSVKEVIFLVTVIVSIATSLLKFNSTLETSQAANKLSYELLLAKVNQNKDNIDRLEKSQDALKSQLADMERLTTQLYIKNK